MPHVFISYRRDDAGYVAGILSQRLERAFGPESVFIDVDHVPLGTDFRTHIRRAVEQCDVLLALIGDAWVDASEGGRRRLDDPADFVRLEIEAALARDIPVVPVLLGKATIPSAADLPPSLGALVYRNAAELRAGRDLDHHLELLVESLATHLGVAGKGAGGAAVQDPGLPARGGAGPRAGRADPGGDAGRMEHAPHADPMQPPVSAARAPDTRYARLRFERAGWVGWAFAIHVSVDGTRVGSLRVGGACDVPVAAGPHRIAASLLCARKAEQHVVVAAGASLAWKVTLSTNMLWNRVQLVQVPHPG